MNNSQAMHENINFVKYEPDNGAEISLDIIPEKAAIQFGGVSPERIYPYRWCYLDRERLTSNRTNALKVNLDSLCCSRRLGAVRNIIKDIINGEINLTKARSIEQAFDWIDKNSFSSRLVEDGKTKELYSLYTDELMHQTKLSKIRSKGRIARSTARNKQLGMARIISKLEGKSLEAILGYASPISPSRGVDLVVSEPRLNEEEAILAFTMHKRFFSSLTAEILDVENRKPPFLVELNDLGFDNYIGYSAYAHSLNSFGSKDETDYWRNTAYTEKGIVGSWPELRGLLLKNGYDLPASGHRNKPIEYKRWESSKIRYKKPYSDETMANLANRACAHFCHLWLFASGGNTEHIESINFNNTRLPRESGANRQQVVKNRASSERQNLTIDAKFLPILRQFVLLREWMLNKYDNSFGNYGVPFIHGNRQSLRFIRPDTLREKATLHWPDNGPSLVTRTGRKLKNNIILEESNGDIGMVSQMMARSEAVTRKSYGFKKFEDAAKQLSAFFDAMQVSAKARTATEPVIPPVIEGGNKITVGRCEAGTELEALKIEGYNHFAPKPRCGAPVTCFFCESYGFHATPDDLLRLLSVKYWIDYQSKIISHNLDEQIAKYSPIIERINDIVEAFGMRDPASAELVKVAEQRASEGLLDPYWKNKVEALIDSLEEF